MTRRYNLRKRKGDVEWVKDDTMEEDETDTSDSDYDPSESEDASSETDMESSETEEEAVIRLPRNAHVNVQLVLHSVVGQGMMVADEESSEDESDGFLAHLERKYASPKKKQKGPLSPVLDLNGGEREYFDKLSKPKKREMNEKMKALSKIVSTGDVPPKFRVLNLPIADQVKADVIKKLDILEQMDCGESYKLQNWVDQFLRIPFGTNIPLPVKMSDGHQKCAEFLSKARGTMDEAVYGMLPAKTQIMQVLAQWIANPDSVGNVVALKGPMGVGKTSFARNGIAKVLERPFQFFSLGGASDSAHFVGHSFTYEGSMCGRIVDSIIHSRCMNPVLYFDELDKISTTSHGEEIVSLLIHLTDRSQNSQFHDRYFAGIDFDLSQCLFVFSFNDESKIHPILRDRLQVIQCSGYSAEDKQVIATQYVWPSLLERLAFKHEDLTLTHDALKHLIEEYSKEEEGVRNLIRAAEMLVTRINLLRIGDAETNKAYKFGCELSFPCVIDVPKVQHLLQETVQKKDESWRSMYN
jgi:ATP-dependent Lon protease